MKRIVCLAVLLVCVVSVSLVFAQTPLDGYVTSIRASMGMWAGMFVAVGGVIIGLLVLLGIHLGPAVIMWIILGFISIGMVGVAASGQLGAWVGVL